MDVEQQTVSTGYHLLSSFILQLAFVLSFFIVVKRNETDKKHLLCKYDVFVHCTDVFLLFADGGHFQFLGNQSDEHVP